MRYFCLWCLFVLLSTWEISACDASLCCYPHEIFLLVMSLCAVIHMRYFCLWCLFVLLSTWDISACDVSLCCYPHEISLLVMSLCAVIHMRYLCSWCLFVMLSHFINKRYWGRAVYVCTDNMCWFLLWFWIFLNCSHVCLIYSDTICTLQSFY